MYEQLAAYYDDVVIDPVHAAWADFTERAWADEAEPVRTVLDVCCGTGRMSAELAARGYSVTGVDGSPAMIAAARELLGPCAALSVSVLPSLTVDGTFDAAVCNFDSLNYLPLDDVRTSLGAIAARLRPGGLLVLDLHTEAMMRTIASAPTSAWRSGGAAFEIENEVDLAARTCRTRLDVRPGVGEPFTETHVQYFFGQDEIAAAMAEEGLTVAALVDDYGDRPVDAGTLRATWVVRAARG